MKKALEEYSVMLDHEYTNGTVNKNLWGMATLLTNAFYNPTNNSINILLGILDEDFYNDDMSKEQIYAGIGSVIGHEISHAFDTNGAQFDKDGNYSNWWTDEDYTAFQNRAQKLIDYYNGITVYGDENAIGSMVQTEAIADMAGIKAMLTLAAKEENFDYKLFFESYAHIWKEISTYEDTYSQLTQDPHPLSYLRVNASVQQFDEFYNAFDVKEGDGMYLAPDNRVLVW
jgi:putative endopeptidase